MVNQVYVITIVKLKKIIIEYGINDEVNIYYKKVNVDKTFQTISNIPNYLTVNNAIATYQNNSKYE